MIYTIAAGIFLGGLALGISFLVGTFVLDRISYGLWHKRSYGYWRFS